MEVDGVAGEHGRGSDDDGACMLVMLRRQHMVVADTFSLPPSYHGCHTSVRSWIDHIAAPARRLCDATTITMLRVAARRLQRIPDFIPRDHVPIRMCVRGGLSFSGAAERGQHRHRDASAAELASGVDRAAIIADFEDALLQAAPAFDALWWDGIPERSAPSRRGGSAPAPGPLRTRDGEPRGGRKVRSAVVSSSGRVAGRSP